MVSEECAGFATAQIFTADCPCGLIRRRIHEQHKPDFRYVARHFWCQLLRGNDTDIWIGPIKFRQRFSRPNTNRIVRPQAIAVPDNQNSGQLTTPFFIQQRALG